MANRRRVVTVLNWMPCVCSTQQTIDCQLDERQQAVLTIVVKVEEAASAVAQVLALLRIC